MTLSPDLRLQAGRPGCGTQSSCLQDLLRALGMDFKNQKREEAKKSYRAKCHAETLAPAPGRGNGRVVPGRMDWPGAEEWV